MHDHRVAGLTGNHTAVATTRPCRAPHHPISAVGRIGGGHFPRPGEGLRAHHGVLALDELPECRCHVLEVFAGRWRSVLYGYHLPHVIALLHEPYSRAVERSRLSHTSMRSRGLLSRRAFWDTITVIDLDRRVALLESQPSSASRRGVGPPHTGCRGLCGRPPPLRLPNAPAVAPWPWWLSCRRLVRGDATAQSEGQSRGIGRERWPR